MAGRLIVTAGGMLVWLWAGLASAETALPAIPDFPFASEAAKAYQQAYAKAVEQPVEWTNALGMKFVLVPPGTFTMGSPAPETGRKDDERQHKVTLTRGFYLGKHEVTVGQFRRFVEATGYETDAEKNRGGHAHDERAVWEHRPGTNWKKPGYAGPYKQADEHPVVHVSHTGALAFCNWLGAREGHSEIVRGYALPTEAQWEWACRAGSDMRFWWGDDEDATGKVANVGDESLKRVHPEWPRTIMPMNDGHAFAAPVGSYRANAFGLHDMLGNVWEFCGSRHGSYRDESGTDPGDLGDKESYSVRGGGWSNVAADCRCATRNSDPPHFGHSNLGFRVAIPLVR
jgi:formylglycine-generating enzyme required for sulfatase activity